MLNVRGSRRINKHAKTLKPPDSHQQAVSKTLPDGESRGAIGSTAPLAQGAGGTAPGVHDNSRSSSTRPEKSVGWAAGSTRKVPPRE